MTSIRIGKYMIYSFYNEEDDVYEKEYFTPDSDLKHFLNRMLTITSYKERGFKIAGTLYVDKETYLNARLAKVVEDYLYEDRYETEVRNKYLAGEINRDVLAETLKLIHDFKWTCLRRIDSIIKRMIREDFEVENEIALQLYDNYLNVRM